MTEDEKIKILNAYPWSFSKVNSYETCPRMFLLSYLEKHVKESNAFSEYGSFCHSLLERYYNGNVEFFELSEIYEDEFYQNVVTPFPPSQYADMLELYYNQGLEYFNNFEGNTGHTKIIAVEEKAEYTIGNYKFIGFIDLVLENKGELILVDHKSKKSFKTQQEKEKYLRQLYLYAGYVFKKYGKYPSKLIFNMFRTRSREVELFCLEKLYQAENWFIQTIEKIYCDTEFRSKFYIRNLEFSYNDRHIRWRYVGDCYWHKLIAIDDLEIADGNNLYIAFSNLYPNTDEDIYFHQEGHEPNYIGVALTDDNEAPTAFICYTWIRFTNDFFCDYICSTRKSCSVHIE